MLDDLAFAVEAKDVNASSFLAGPIQITHVYDGKIPVDGNTFHLAGNAAGLPDVGNDVVEHIRKKRVVLNVWPGNKTRKQIGSALIKNLVVYNVDRVLDMLSCHKASFEISVSGIFRILQQSAARHAVMPQIALGGNQDGFAEACPTPSATFCRTLDEASTVLQSWHSNRLRGF